MGSSALCCAPDPDQACDSSGWAWAGVALIAGASGRYWCRCVGGVGGIECGVAFLWCSVTLAELGRDLFFVFFFGARFLIFLVCGSAARRAGRIWLATTDYSSLRRTGRGPGSATIP
jgi:hypothetical protein